MMQNKYRNSILLSAIGDALGWITEFEKTSENLESKYKSKYINKFYYWEKNVGGRFNGYKDIISEGSYSDDTQLLLSVARSIKENGNLDNVYFSKTELPSWLLYARGAGRTIKNAARKITRNSATWNNNFFTFNAGKQKIDYRESGANGAAMRILPIALANYGNIEKIKENIFANSIVTHGHPRAILGAILYGYSINLMLNQNSSEFDYEHFLTEIGKDINNKLQIDFIIKPVYSAWLKEWNKNQNIDFVSLYNSTIDETLQLLRKTFISLRDNSDVHNTLKEFGCFNSSTKGSGIITVIAGIYLACKYAKEPEMAITEAVNAIGSDTDSIAAFSGSLVGALYEKDIIPEKWENVQDSEYLKFVAERLHQISVSKLIESDKIYKSDQIKSLNNITSDTYQINEKVWYDPIGLGTITNIDKQNTLTKGKFNLIIDVNFNIGQSCRFSKLLNL